MILPQNLYKWFYHLNYITNDFATNYTYHIIDIYDKNVF